MTAEREQSTGLPIMLQHGSARLPVSTFNPPLGTSYDVQIQFALKPTAFCRMPAQKLDQCRATVLMNQFILQRKNGLMTARITLAGTASGKLPINPFGLVAAGGDDMQATHLGNPVSEGDVGPAPGHIGRHSDLSLLPCGGNNFSLFSILPGIQYPVCDSRLSQFLTQQLGVGNRPGTKQHRSSLPLHLCH
jgi:hypothetical protein